MIPRPLPDFPISDGGTSEDHVARLGPGRFAVDLAVPLGTELPYPGDWEVFKAGEDSERARWVDIAWPDADGVSWRLMWCHLDRVLPGGRVIGTVGMTGRTDGPHVHLVMHRNTTRVRPEDYIDFDQMDSLIRDPVGEGDDEMLTYDERFALKDHLGLISACLNQLHEVEMLLPRPPGLTTGQQGLERVTAIRAILRGHGLVD